MLLKRTMAGSLSILALALFPLVSDPEAGLAAEEVKGKAEFDKAMKLYKSRNYGQAGDMFWNSVVAGNPLPIAWLMTAHSRAGAGNNTEARKLYREIMKTFKGTKEAAAARECLIKLKGKPDTVSTIAPVPTSGEAAKPASKPLPPIKADSDLAKAIKFMHKKDYASALAFTDSHLKKNPTDPNAYYYKALCHHYRGRTGKAASSYKKVVEISPDSSLGKKAKAVLARISPQRKSTNSVQNRKTDPALVNRIEVKPALEGRPQVSKVTIETTKDVIRNLPPSIAQMLYKGDAKITLASNRVDRFPNTKNETEEKNPKLLTHERQSESIGREACIYERGMWEMTGRLKPAHTQSVIRKNLLRELGNLVSDINGKFTNVEDVKKAYAEDKKRVSGNIKNLYPEYLRDQPEGFERTVAEIIASYIGANDREAQIIRNGFPRVNRWIKIRMGF